MMITSCRNKIPYFFTTFSIFVVTCSASANGYLGASVGASFAKLGNTSPQIAYFSGTTITDAYPLSKTHTSTGLLGINAGYEINIATGKPTIAIGLGVYTNLANYHYSGQLVETAEGDASSVLYNYRYHLNSTRMMAEIQLNWMMGQFSPFVNFGVGPSWSRMSNYHEMPINDTGFTALPPFQSHTTTQAAYQAGFGISKSFDLSNNTSKSPKDRVALGYRYVNCGATSFEIRDQVYPYRLNTGSLKTNDVYLSYTHLF